MKNGKAVSGGLVLKITTGYIVLNKDDTASLDDYMIISDNVECMKTSSG